MNFAGGLFGRERLGSSSGSLPEIMNVRSLVPRGVATKRPRAEFVPRYARLMMKARFEHVPPGQDDPDPLPGDFILTHGGEFFSRVIQFGQGLRFMGKDRPYTYWNHSALIVSADGALIEALGPGVQRNTLASYKGTQYTVVHIDASDEDRKEMVAFAEHYVGGQYDWATIVSITLSLLTGARLSFGFTGQQICSGLVARALERTTAIFDEEPSHVMPAELAKMFDVVPPPPETPKGKPVRCS